MSQTAVIAGTIAQVLLGGVLWIFAMFGSAGAADHASRAGRVLSTLESSVLDGSVYLVPGLCFLSAAAVFMLHRGGAGTWAYWLYVPPLLVAGAYAWFISSLFA